MTSATKVGTGAQIADAGGTVLGNDNEGFKKGVGLKWGNETKRNEIQSHR